MNTRHFEYLITVADCGSIGQAAERLHLKQQNLSTIIKNIEVYYEISIFTRSHKGVTLTDDGKFFLEKARTILSLMEQLDTPYLYPSKKIYTNIVGSINIYLSDTLSSPILVTLIDEFHQNFPYANINVLNKTREHILDSLSNNSEALGIINLPDFASNFISTLPKGLKGEPFIKGALNATTSMNNPEARNLTSISIRDLLQKKLILYCPGQPNDTFLYHILCHYGEPDIQYTVGNSSIFSDLMQKNNHWSIGRKTQASQHQLLAIPFQEDIAAQSYLVYNEQAKESFLMKSLLKLFSTYAQKML